MAKLQTLSEFTKKQNNILHKDYYEKVIASIKSQITQSDLKFNAKASQLKSSNLLASISLEYEKNNFLVKVKKRSDNLFHFLFDYSPKAMLDSIKTRLEYKVSTQGIQTKLEPKISIFYYGKNVRFLASLKDSPLLTYFNLIAGKTDYGVSADCQFALNSQKYTEHSIALWWHPKHTKITAKHISSDFSIGRFEFSYYLKLSPILHMTSLITSTWSTKATNIQIAADYKLDAHTMVKGKIDSAGKIGMAIKRQLSEKLEITLGTNVDTKGITSSKVADCSFGFTLDFIQ